MKIMIIVNSVVYNRGTEALVKGLIKVLHEKYNLPNITLVSGENNVQNKVNINLVTKIVPKSVIKHHSFKNYCIYLLSKFSLFKDFALKIKYKKLLYSAIDQDLILVIGADNYDITYKFQKNMYDLNKLLKNYTKGKMILLDCSFAKRDITETLFKDLSNFDNVTVRESLSKENIINLYSNVLTFPDPAFVLDKEKVDFPKKFQNNTIGINLSNLITNPKYGSNKEKILESYYNLIEYILNNTSYNILLIPHVMNGADLNMLRIIYNKYLNNKRIGIIDNENLSANELKYIISKMKIFVGARTHATIAAYSSYVPTLVLGYSIKSIGIAKDIFGNFENYVLPVEKLMEHPDFLTNSFIYIMKNKEKIHNYLLKFMPNYINKIYGLFDVIEMKVHK